MSFQVCLAALIVWLGGCWNRLFIHWDDLWDEAGIQWCFHMSRWLERTWSGTVKFLYHSRAWSHSSLAYVTLCYLLPTHTLGNLLLLTGYYRIQDLMEVLISFISDFYFRSLIENVYLVTQLLENKNDQRHPLVTELVIQMLSISKTMMF